MFYSANNSDRSTHMFRVKVHYNDKDTVLNCGFWPECVGCRHYIEQAICDSHFKEKLNAESIAVAKIKSDPHFFLQICNRISICKSDIGHILSRYT